MSVITIRVKPHVKQKMKILDIRWSKEIRDYIERRIAQEERRRFLTKISKELDRIPSTERGFSTRSVRDDRDR